MAWRELYLNLSRKEYVGDHLAALGKRPFEKLRQEPFCSVGKSFVVEAPANYAASYTRCIVLVLWRLDPPAILILAAALEVIHHRFTHVPQIARVIRVEFADLAKIDGAAKPQGRNAFVELQHFPSRCHHQISFSSPRSNCESACFKRSPHWQFRIRQSVRLRNSGPGPLDQSIQGHKPLLIGRHDRTTGSFFFFFLFAIENELRDNRVGDQFELLCSAMVQGGGSGVQASASNLLGGRGGIGNGHHDRAGASITHGYCALPFTAKRGALWAVVLPPQQLRQLGEIRCNSPRLILGQQFGRRAALRGLNR